MKRAILSFALLLVLGLPFVLRPRGHAAAAQDTVVVITPHNEAIRQEFGRAFAAWYRQKTGRTIEVDWRVVGGTGDISRFLESAYAAAFELYWTRDRRQQWTTEVAAAIQSSRVAQQGSASAQGARAAFLTSGVSSGVDIFFGGDAYQYGKEADAGRLVPAGVETRHPDWFGDGGIPLQYHGEPFRDPQGRWYGVVLSSYGMIYNRELLRRIGVTRPPETWTDLADPRFRGELGLADPTKSGSVCEAFENIIQEQMQRRIAELGESRSEAEQRQAVAAGWTDGVRLIQLLGANARYFTDASQKPPIDVANGDCAAGLCIDFYGRQQIAAVERRGAMGRVDFNNARHGSAVSTDPIGLLRGAPHRDAAQAFIDYTLSPEGQKLWAFRVGVPGGPTRFALRRMPIRPDFYTQTEWRELRSDPQDNPYDSAAAFVYRPEWTGHLFREIGFVTRVVCQDLHEELVRAWTAIAAAPEPARSRALAILQDVAAVNYEQTNGAIHQRLNARDRLEEVKLAAELRQHFREQYTRATAEAERR